MALLHYKIIVCLSVYYLVNIEAQNGKEIFLALGIL